jgi:hypothetical protein
MGERAIIATRLAVHRNSGCGGCDHTGGPKSSISASRRAASCHQVRPGSPTLSVCWNSRRNSATLQVIGLSASPLDIILSYNRVNFQRSRETGSSRASCSTRLFYSSSCPNGNSAGIGAGRWNFALGRYALPLLAESRKPCMASSTAMARSPLARCGRPERIA